LSIYADASFIVSLYVRYAHMPEAQRLMLTRPAVWLTPFHRAEWTHAVERHVFEGTMSREEAEAVHTNFELDRTNALWLEVAFPETAFELCTDLALRHVAQIGSRTLDTLHVAAALELNAERFWTFDERQAKLARSAGLKTRC
jgi:predicted nucleic acid-binding protein